MARKRKSSSGGGSPVYFFVIVATAMLAGWLYFEKPWTKALGSKSSPSRSTNTPAPSASTDTQTPEPPKPAPTRTPEGPATPVLSIDPPAEGNIRIATWNLRRVGGPATANMRTLAQIITASHFDVVAVQEVERDGSSVTALVNALGNPWHGTPLSSPSQSGERLGFIYRTDRVQEISSPALLPGSTAKTGLFERPPYCGMFRSGSFDFELVNVHLSVGDVEQEYEEADILARLVQSAANTQKEHDIIVLGDFNERKARPTMHYLESNGWRTVVRQTTNVGSTENYDHIVFSTKYTPEHAGQSGVVRFDEVLFSQDRKAAIATVSDHRPVWADFNTTLADDD